MTVEFALIAPILILVYIGCSEVYVSFTMARKVQAVTGAVNDIVSRSDNVSAQDLQKIFGLTKVALVPFDPAPIRIRTTAIAVDNAGNAKVEWSCGDTGSGGSAAGDKADLPPSLSGLRSVEILKTQTSYGYRPFSGYLYNGTIDLGGIAYADPRYSEHVTSPGC